MLSCSHLHHPIRFIIQVKYTARYILVLHYRQLSSILYEVIPVFFNSQLPAPSL